MAEPNILLTRIDNRLIHGQVATQWNSTLGANLILVANDEVSTNTMRQNLMKMAAPAGVATRFFSLQHTIDIISKASPKQKIFIVAETPQDVLTLVKGGVPIRRSTSATCTCRKEAAGCNDGRRGRRRRRRFQELQDLGWSWRSGVSRARGGGHGQALLVKAQSASSAHRFACGLVRMS